MSKLGTVGLVAVAVLAAAGSVAAQGSSSSKAAPSLNDAQVAHVAVTANAIDVGMAQLAEKRTKNADVQAFAATMIRDHTAVNAQAAALAKRLGVTPLDNDVSKSLESGATAARAKLSPLSGKAFDRAYIEREVGYHAAVLDALDKVLIPDAQNAELKALLTNVRPAIAAHLEHAKSLQQKLAAK